MSDSNVLNIALLIVLIVISIALRIQGFPFFDTKKPLKATTLFWVLWFVGIFAICRGFWWIVIGF
jgi:hypothetical protein